VTRAEAAGQYARSLKDMVFWTVAGLTSRESGVEQERRCDSAERELAEAVAVLTQPSGSLLEVRCANCEADARRERERIPYSPIP
jgi:hypothetical protein